MHGTYERARTRRRATSATSATILVLAALSLTAALPPPARAEAGVVEQWAQRAADALWNAIPESHRKFLEDHRPEVKQWLQDQSFLRIALRQEMVVSDAFLTETFKRNIKDDSLRGLQVHVSHEGIVELRGRKKVFIFSAGFFFHIALDGYRFDESGRVFRLHIRESKPRDYDPAKEGTFDGIAFVQYVEDGRRILVDLDKLVEAPRWFHEGWVRLVRIKDIRLMDGEIRVRFDLSRVDEVYNISGTTRQIVAGVVGLVQDVSR